MLNAQIETVLRKAAAAGWVLEPEAKKLLQSCGIDVPKFALAATVEDARRAAAAIGYPVVAKVVSPQVVHKSDVGGVIAGIPDADALAAAYRRLSRLEDFAGMLVEELLSGVELIIGAKNDTQFGPVILLGIGGTGVEIYQDTTLRMAPLSERDVASMVRSLKGRRLLQGFRGSAALNMDALRRLMLAFSELVMTIGARIEAIDLNPVICNAERCVVADARIMLGAHR
jgi:acyl-CoA synthetase (NDP forming)